jgi:hypothetical protein
VNNEATPAGRYARAIDFSLYLVSVVFFVGFVVDQVLWRHVHVDEFQQAANAQILVRFGRADFATGVEPWMIPYGLLTKSMTTSLDVVVVGRAFFTAMALCSLVVLGQCQPFDQSQRGRAIATCALVCSLPFWRHGFEVRHDLFQLVAAAAAFWLLSLASQQRVSVPKAVASGIVCAVSALNCMKAVIVFAPLLVLAVFVHAPTIRERLRLFSAIVVGACVGVVLTAAGLWSTGHGALAWQTVLDLVAAVAGGTSDLSYDRFGPGPLLAGFVVGEPLLCLGLLLTVILAFSGRILDSKTALLLLAPVAIAVVFLVVNPTPYPYSMVATAPFLVLAGVGSLHTVVRRAGAPELGVVFVALQLATTARAVSRDPYLNADNQAQAERMAAAEALTAPDDPVLDGVGIVCNRPPATKDWLLHSALMRSYMAGRRASFATVLKTAPPVVITNYRWSWLPPDVASTLEQAYVKLADDVWVLSPTSDLQSGTIHIPRAGRYLVTAHEATAASAQVGKVATAPGEIVVLPAGTLSVAWPGPQPLRLVWIGPHLTELPEISPTDALFVPEEQPY